MSNEAKLIEKIHKVIANRGRDRVSTSSIDDMLLLGNTTINTVYHESLSNYRYHYMSDEDQPDALGHVPVYSARYKRSFDTSPDSRSLRWPRFNPNRLDTKDGWRKIERSYVRATQISHRTWNKLGETLLQTIEECSLAVVNNVYVLFREDDEISAIVFEFTKDGKLRSFANVTNKSELDYTNPGIAIIHEQFSATIISAFRQNRNAQRRYELMRFVLMRWAFPKYHAKEEFEVIDAPGSVVTTIIARATPDCPFDRAYVMQGSSQEVHFPAFWPYGSLNTIE
jgi:hypothetical protein